MSEKYETQVATMDFPLGGFDRVITVAPNFSGVSVAQEPTETGQGVTLAVYYDAAGVLVAEQELAVVPRWVLGGLQLKAELDDTSDLAADTDKLVADVRAKHERDAALRLVDFAQQLLEDSLRDIDLIDEFIEALAQGRPKIAEAICEMIPLNQLSKELDQTMPGVSGLTTNVLDQVRVAARRELGL